MVLLENFRIALTALKANALRSVLTTLGIVIGVAAVIAVVSVVQGLEVMITKELQGVGATYMQVSADFGQRQPGMVAREVKLTWDDGKTIARRVPGVRLITPVAFGRAQIKAGDRKYSPSGIYGVNQDYQEVANSTVDRGRFLSRVDLDSHKKVVVLGQKVVDELVLGPNPVGREIYVGAYPMTVIGVMEKKGQSLTGDLDDRAFIPFDSAATLFSRLATDNVQLRIQARTAEDVPQVRDAISALLRQRHHLAKGQPDDFRIQVEDEMLKTVGGIVNGITAVVGGIVGIALLVGGIGIMNIMLVSVTERTREIGVRKAVGARRQDVLLQFLIEAVALSLVGGALGLAAGYGLGVLLAAVLPDWPPARVPLWAVGLAFGFSTLVGVFFGIYPAGKASRLNAIESLRYE
ncbi:MAG TPA: ABC transporter permease [Thermoanaerobaculia bacterium]|nr:ABC transporter permease [Thermoanaerobaculia bacterium]